MAEKINRPDLITHIESLETFSAEELMYAANDLAKFIGTLEGELEKSIQRVKSVEATRGFSSDSGWGQELRKIVEQKLASDRAHIETLKSIRSLILGKVTQGKGSGSKLKN